MSWASVKEAVGKAAPLLGTLLGGPAGAAVGAIVSSTLGVENKPEAVLEELQANPEALVKLREVEARRHVELEALAVDQVKAELAAVGQLSSDINKTMQAEAVSEKWPQYSWRPAIGFSVAVALFFSTLTVLVSYLAAIFYNRPEALSHLPGILAAIAGVIGMASPILGIASWFRGKEKIEKVGR